MPDAVVVGAGPNGLAAAIRLAEAGREVVVLEEQATPGGAVKTQGLTLDGFRHDTFSAVYPAAAASPVFARMPLADFGLEWVHPPVAVAHPLGEDRGAALHRSLEDTAASLDRLAPGSGREWTQWATPFLDVFDEIRDTMLSGFPPLTGPLKMVARGGPLRLAKFAALIPDSAQRLTTRIFSDPAPRPWLQASAMHGDVSPRKPGSAAAAVYLQLLGHAVGWPSPKGGAVAITDALVGHLASLGGQVRCGARVERVVARGGRVTGVGVAGGEHVAASTVVADVMPGALAEMAGDALAGWYRALLGRYVRGPSTLKLDWALDRPIPWSFAEAREAGTVHVAGTEEQFDRSLAEAERGLPEHPFMLLGQQSLADPSRAPEGKHTAWAYTHAPQDAEWTPATQERLADAMEAQIERFAPGFRECILARHALGPAELEGRDRNLSGGDVGGGSYRLDQLVFRPVPKLTPYATPLRGLFIGSAATFPGGAVHGVPGDAAARAALRPRLPF